MKKRVVIWIVLFLSMLLINQRMGMNQMVVAENSSRALIVVDPGFSNFSFQIAQKIAGELQAKKVSYKIVKTNQFKNEDAQNIEYIFIGGPTYVGQPSPKIKKFLSDFKPKSKLKAILFLTAGQDESGLIPFINLVQGKGLTVLSNTVILTTLKDHVEVDNKISKLLEVL